MQQHQHAGLQLGQAGQCVFQALAQFVFGEQRFGAVLMPGMGRQQPVAAIGETLVTHRACGAARSSSSTSRRLCLSQVLAVLAVMVST